MALTVLDSSTWDSVLCYLKVGDVIRLFIAGKSLQHVIKPVYRDLDLQHTSTCPVAFTSLIWTLQHLSSHPRSLKISSPRKVKPWTMEREVDWSFFAPTLQTLVLDLKEDAPLLDTFNPIHLPHLTTLEIHSVARFSEKFALPPNLTKLACHHLRQTSVIFYAPLIRALMNLPPGLRVLDVKAIKLSLSGSQVLDWTHLPLEKVSFHLDADYPIQWSFLPRMLKHLDGYLGSIKDTGRFQEEIWATVPPPREGWDVLFPSLVSLSVDGGSALYHAFENGWNLIVDPTHPELVIGSLSYAASFPLSLRSLSVRGFSDHRLQVHSPDDVPSYYEPLFHKLVPIAPQLTSLDGLDCLFPKLASSQLLGPLKRYPTRDIQRHDRFSMLLFPHLETFSLEISFPGVALAKLVPLPSTLTSLRLDIEKIIPGYLLPGPLRRINAWPSTLTRIQFVLQMDERWSAKAKTAPSTLQLDALPAASLTSLELRLSPSSYLRELAVTGSLKRFSLLKHLVLGMRILIDGDRNASIVPLLPPCLTHLQCLPGNIKFADFATHPMELLETLLLRVEKSPVLVGLSIDSMTDLPRNLLVLEFAVTSTTSPITETFIKSLPRTLQRLKIRNLKFARWEFNSAACLAHLPKRLQKMTLRRDEKYDESDEEEHWETQSQISPAKRSKHIDLHTLPRDILDFLPLSLKLRTDYLSVKAKVKAARKRWLQQERKNYFARWNLVWLYTAEEERSMDTLDDYSQLDLRGPYEEKSIDESTEEEREVQWF